MANKLKCWTFIGIALAFLALLATYQQRQQRHARMQIEAIGGTISRSGVRRMFFSHSFDGTAVTIPFQTQDASKEPYTDYVIKCIRAMGGCKYITIRSCRLIDQVQLEPRSYINIQKLENTFPNASIAYRDP